MKEPGTGKSQEKSRRLRLHLACCAGEMIKEAGIESFSARKLSLRAGYALGTIYNHFSALDELLWMTRSHLIQEMGLSLMRSQELIISKREDLLQAFQGYMNYFISNPNIYRFLYFHHLDPQLKTEKSWAESEEFSRQMARSFSFLKQSNGYTDTEITAIRKTLVFSLQGILTLVISDNDGLTKEQAFVQVEEILRYLIPEPESRGEEHE